MTRATPTAARRHLTEGYVTQPVLMATAATGDGRLEGMAMLNMEGRTLQRGELTTGMYGEGYVDRRHPHAYVHEVVATLRSGMGGRHHVSITAGRGFAAFGSDDPMVRPFVKYPVNHHLAQVLERAVVTGAIRVGIVGVEASVFNGDEPRDAGDLPSLRRFGDSWAMRATVHPVDAVELSASHAFVASPEVRAGFGVDARKWHASTRVQRGGVYGLAEWARTTDVDAGRHGSSYRSALAEAAYVHGGSGVAVRLERTDRHEEERLEDPFRTPPSSGAPHQLAVTRWTTVTAALSHEVGTWGGLRAAPFVELAVARVALRSGIAFDPESFYGARSLAMVTAGLRLVAGRWHARMGRYGVAAAISPHAQH